MAHGMFEKSKCNNASAKKARGFPKVPRSVFHVLFDIADAAALMMRIIINVLFWRSLHREISK